jgi:hypothetical protein
LIRIRIIQAIPSGDKHHAIRHGGIEIVNMWYFSCYSPFSQKKSPAHFTVLSKLKSDCSCHL